MSDGVSLSTEHEELRRTVERFARAEVAPVIGSYYERHEFPYDLVEKMAALGLFGLPFPSSYGGMDGDLFVLCLALEELGRVDSSVAITLDAAVTLGATPIYRFGTEAQRRQWLPELCRGEMLGAFALTEASGGTDVRSLRTTARRENGYWVINGSKSFITNSGTGITGPITVLARTSEGNSPASFTSIIVPAGTTGLSVAPGYSKVGWCASDTRELSFVDCRVPEENLLGDEGRGYAQFLETLDEGRVALGALSVGLAQGCVDESLRYLGEREAFGHKLADSQVLQFMLADMEVRTHAARLAYRDAARRVVAGEAFKKEAAIAKLLGSDAAMANARDATQVFGGAGFMNETPVGRFYRDAKVLEIGEGTSEVQRAVIARQLGLPGTLQMSGEVEELDVALHDGVFTLLLQREHRANALSPELARRMSRALTELPEAARVVLIASSGERVFCAGMDLSAVGDATSGDGPEAIRELVSAIRACRLPVVVRVHGLCLAGGVAVALAGDLVVCGENVEWGLPEVDRGLWPFMVGLLLSRQVSEKIALDWMLTGRRFTASEARDAGLVSRLVPAADLDAATGELCALLATKAPLAVERGIAAFRRTVDLPFETGLAEMAGELAALSETADAREGIAAFGERRPPHWKGR